MRERKSRITLIWIAFLLFITGVVHPVYAENREEKVVRVGYVITPGYQEGKEGEYKSGQGYEYLQKIAGYTGWTYEYVYGSFRDLFEQLCSGEIDLMGNISYSEARSTKVLYGKQEAGKESFYLYVNGLNSPIQEDRPASIRGKKIGGVAGSYQLEVWKNWCARNLVQCELVEYALEEELQDALSGGEVDGAVEILMLNRTERTRQWRSVLKYGEASYYFAVSRERPELWEELNQAQTRILNENPYYNEQLSTRYLQADNLPSRQFSEDETEWLESHGRHLKVGCLDGYLPLSGTDAEGNTQGVLPDVFALMSDLYSDYDITFEPVVYSEYRQIIRDLKAGVIDIAAPVYGDYWNADQEGVCLTDPVLSTTMLLMHEGAYSPSQIKKIGVDEQSPLQMTYAAIYYSDYEVVMYPSLDAAAKALHNKEVDAALCSACSYHVAAQRNSTIRDMNRVTLPGNVNISMAVAKQNPQLMSILNRGFAQIGETAIFNSMAMHSNVDRNYTLIEYVVHNPLPVIAICLIAFLVLASYVIRLRKAIRKAETDPMTGLLNKMAMREQIREHLPQGGVLFMIDIDHFKDVNDVLGHKEGDHVLTQFASNLGRIFRSGDVIGRFGGDEFMVFLPKADFGDALIELKVNQMQQVLSPYTMEVDGKSVVCSVSVGVVRIRPQEPIAYDEVFKKADEALYEAKNIGRCTYVIAE